MKLVLTACLVELRSPSKVSFFPLRIIRVNSLEPCMPRSCQDIMSTIMMEAGTVFSAHVGLAKISICTKGFQWLFMCLREDEGVKPTCDRDR